MKMLVLKEGVIYNFLTDTPHTGGFIISAYPPSQTTIKGSLKKGIVHGSLEAFHKMDISQLNHITKMENLMGPIISGMKTGRNWQKRILRTVNRYLKSGGTAKESLLIHTRKL